jgi:hypothetical protein
MKTTRTPPWEKPPPRSRAARMPLTADQKEAARRRAERAGRRYPNLIDNMWAARQRKPV